MPTVCPPGAVRLIERLGIVLVAICGFAVPVSAETTVTLSTPGSHLTADLTIQGGDSGMSDFSTSDVLATKASANDDYKRRILLKFDTQHYIPDKAVVRSARLYLVLKNAEDSADRPLTAYRVTRSFAKREANWYYFRYGQGWSTPGGDLGSKFATSYVDNHVGSTYTFDLTKMVQQTVSGDFGSRYTRIAIVDTGGNSTGSYRAFHSSRAANTSLRPRLVVTYTTAASGASGASPAKQSAPASSTGGTLRVMQWNIHKTKGSDGRCNPDRIASTIAAQQVDVVSLNEVNFFSGECAFTFDMGEKLDTLLQQKTGVSWTRQSVNAGGVGNILLSRYRPVSSSSHLLSNGRGIAQMGVVVNGRTVNVFSTHVEYYNASWRKGQIAEAIRWLTGFSAPRIVMGDFNTSPGTPDYSTMAGQYQDAWAAGSSAGTASAFNGSGSTHGASRFDYIFYSKNSTLSVKSVKVPNTRGKGVAPSDHDPVVAVFSVK